MSSETISESIINGVKVSFYCVSGTPVGDIYIVSAPKGEQVFW